MPATRALTIEQVKQAVEQAIDEKVSAAVQAGVHAELKRIGLFVEENTEVRAFQTDLLFLRGLRQTSTSILSRAVMWLSLAVMGLVIATFGKDLLPR